MFLWFKLILFYWNFPGTVVRAMCFHYRGAQVQSLIRELRSHMLYSTEKESLSLVLFACEFNIELTKCLNDDQNNPSQRKDKDSFER